MQMAKHNNEVENKASFLTDESKNKIDVWLKKFPENKKQSAVIPALFIAQEQNKGYLTDSLIAAVANYLNIPKVSAEEVATFYSMYQHKPVGKYVISVCTNVSCMLCGSDKIVDHLNKKLAIKFNQTTKDGKFSLKEVECFGACVGAPMMEVNKTYYENLTEDKIDNILDNLE